MFKQLLTMITVTILLNLIFCAYVTSAFVMQMIVHFPFMDWDTYAEDNLRHTAYWYTIPLIAEVSTAWSTFENWYPVMTILLCLGWILCIPIWYYQVRMSEGMGYGTHTQTENIILFSRARGVLWLARLIMLTIWVIQNM